MSRLCTASRPARFTRFVRPVRSACAALVLGATLAATAMAQEPFPSREVRLIAPFPAGSGATDAVARMVADKLREYWSQPVVVTNVPGAAGSVGMARLAAAPRDGYTIAVSGDAAIVTNVSLYRKLAYDPVRDLLPVAMVGRTANVLVVHKDRGPKTLPELVTAAKAKPGTLSFTSNGFGTSQHIAIELLRLQAGVEVVHAPAPGQAMQNVMGGHVDAAFQNMPVALPQIRSGAVRGLAQTGRTRSPAAPDLPTVAELGYPGFEAVTWAGVFLPAGTPDPVLRRIAADVSRMLADPAFAARLAELGVEVAAPDTPEGFARFIGAEISRVGELVRAAGIKLDL